MALTRSFRIEMLPARHGDCLWLEYGGRRVRRLLIDGGPVSTHEALLSRIESVPKGQRALELVVLTHVDADHVEGLVRLFANKPLPFVVRKVLFNGWRQMQPKHGLLGPLQGEFLSALLAQRVRASVWNPSGPPAVVPPTGKLPTLKLDGGLQLTLLSPSVPSLQAMAKAWAKDNAIQKKGFKPGDLEAAWDLLASKRMFLPAEGLLGVAPNLDRLLKQQYLADSKKPNGSSIAFLAEYAGKSALLLGDAHSAVLEESITRLLAQRGEHRLKVDAVKVSHHGSSGNTSVRLLHLIESPRWLISTNGDQFGHPDPACIARILKHGRAQELWFNYRSKYTARWLSADSQRKHRYKAYVRKDQDLSLVVDL